MEDSLWWKTTFDRRWLLMEDNLWWKKHYDRSRSLIWDELRFSAHQKFFQLKYFFYDNIFFWSKNFQTKFFSRNLETYSDNPKITKPTQICQIKPVKPNLSSTIYQTKPSKPSLPNHTYEANSAKPNLQNQAYQTKTYQIKPKFPKEQKQSAKIKFMSKIGKSKC